MKFMASHIEQVSITDGGYYQYQQGAPFYSVAQS